MNLLAELLPGKYCRKFFIIVNWSSKISWTSPQKCIMMLILCSSEYVLYFWIWLLDMKIIIFSCKINYNKIMLVFQHFLQYFPVMYRFLSSVVQSRYHRSCLSDIFRDFLGDVLSKISLFLKNSNNYWTNEAVRVLWLFNELSWVIVNEKSLLFSRASWNKTSLPS